MSSNSKTFLDVNEAEYQAFRNSVRAKGWAPPGGNTGMLRNPAGLNADLNYDLKSTTLSMRIRSLSKGDTYDSIFGEVANVLKSVDR